MESQELLTQGLAAMGSADNYIIYNMMPKVIKDWQRWHRFVK
jgi:hypothetical protein